MAHAGATDPDLLAAAFALIGDEGWRGFSFATLARRTGVPPRDRVFELLMCRLESLVPYRAGLARLARDARADPCVVLATACRLERSLMWLQDVAGVRRHGLRASLARRALGLAYVRAVQVWFEDEGADLGKTMAELDKQLRRIQNVAGLREPRARRAEGEAA